jgi:hypothetical protein
VKKEYQGEFRQIVAKFPELAEELVKVQAQTLTMPQGWER